ncbi:MAG: hypothetical protein P4L42_11740 [Desulfocapsaceae bacterium]|nr:hypothetical protein [Desulfocapsaceae bacterium]
MRCPKCGYISFDHLATCLNCSKDFSESSLSALGTTYSSTAPSFLQFSRREEAQEDYGGPARHDQDEGLDIVDPDLDILLKEEEEGGFGSDDLSLKDEFGSSGEDFAFPSDDEGREAESPGGAPEIDLSQFEEVHPDSGMGDAGDEKFMISMPDELTDLSDLGPPASLQPGLSADAGQDSHDEVMNFDSLDLDLRLDGLDADFPATSPEKGRAEEGITDLSLEDIDASVFGEETKPAPAQAPKAASAARSDEMDMDADLDFELDLGGLSIPRK